ncbi:hypothetical protein ACQWF6_25050, partial [Salmonella enterica subsp. enterica serovar Infantis]
MQTLGLIKTFNCVGALLNLFCELLFLNSMSFYNIIFGEILEVVCFVWLFLVSIGVGDFHCLFV